MIAGRDEDRAAIDGLLDAARRRSGRALVVRGEGGVGKTALLADAAAGASDMNVLWAVGVESEAELPFASLHQVLAPSLDRTADRARDRSGTRPPRPRWSARPSCRSTRPRARGPRGICRPTSAVRGAAG